MNIYHPLQTLACCFLEGTREDIYFVILKVQAILIKDLPLCYPSNIMQHTQPALVSFCAVSRGTLDRHQLREWVSHVRQRDITARRAPQRGHMALN